MVKVWAVGQGWDLGRDLVKAEGWVCLVLCAGLAPPDVEVLVTGLAPPGVGWALAVVKDWGLGVAKACRLVPLPGCV